MCRSKMQFGKSVGFVYFNLSLINAIGCLKFNEC